MEGVRCGYNAGYEKGMFSSVQTGVGEMTEDFFLTPGDYPLLKPSTLATLLRHRGPVRVPTFEGRGGHPIFISGSLIEALLKEPYASNLKRFRDRQTVTWVPVDDRGSIEDMDTIEDYENIHEMIKRAKD